jgi:hypothetical protein
MFVVVCVCMYLCVCLCKRKCQKSNLHPKTSKNACVHQSRQGVWAHVHTEHTRTHTYFVICYSYLSPWSEPDTSEAPTTIAFLAVAPPATPKGRSYMDDDSPSLPAANKMTSSQRSYRNLRTDGQTETCVYSDPDMCVLRSRHVYTQIQTCVYSDRDMCILRSRHVYTQIQTCVYSDRDMCILRSRHVYTQIETCVYSDSRVLCRDAKAPSESCAILLLSNFHGG